MSRACRPVLHPITTADYHRCTFRENARRGTLPVHSAVDHHTPDQQQQLAVLLLSSGALLRLLASQNSTRTCQNPVCETRSIGNMPAVSIFISDAWVQSSELDHRIGNVQPASRFETKPINVVKIDADFGATRPDAGQEDYDRCGASYEDRADVIGHFADVYKE